MDYQPKAFLLLPKNQTKKQFSLCLREMYANYQIKATGLYQCVLGHIPALFNPSTKKVEYETQMIFVGHTKC